MPALTSRASTYCVLVRAENLLTNSGRLTKSLKYACLFASSCASKFDEPETRSFCNCCVSFSNSPYRTGTGGPPKLDGKFPNAALLARIDSTPVV